MRHASLDIEERHVWQAGTGQLMVSMVSWIRSSGSGAVMRCVSMHSKQYSEPADMIIFALYAIYFDFPMIATLGHV